LSGLSGFREREEIQNPEVRIIRSSRIGELQLLFRILVMIVIVVEASGLSRGILNESIG
jgi:hypothetical protein